MWRTKKPKRSGWNLYSVVSDGDEDCFVVARNIRSALRVEAEYCGFDPTELSVYRVKPIPAPIVTAYAKRSANENRHHRWTWYADDWLLRKMGAQFGERESLLEVLIDDVVYTRGADDPVQPRTIGRKYLTEFRANKAFAHYGQEDHYSTMQMHLFTMLGICVARCQEIEHLIAHSFILGVSDAERRKYETIRDMIRGWRHKTLGQMLRSIEQGYEIDPTVHASLNLFLSMRNRLVHELTVDEQYDITAAWGQDETLAFLVFFEFVLRPVRRAFRASFYASVEYGNTYLLRDDPAKRQKLTKRQQKEISLFVAYFNQELHLPDWVKGELAPMAANLLTLSPCPAERYSVRRLARTTV